MCQRYHTAPALRAVRAVRDAWVRRLRGGRSRAGDTMERGLEYRWTEVADFCYSQGMRQTSWLYARYKITVPNWTFGDGDVTEKANIPLTQIEDLQRFSGQRSAVSGQRSAVSGQRSAVSGQRSAVSGQRSAVSGQRSAVSGQRSAVSGQRSAVSGQRSAVSGQRSAVSGQRSAVSGQRSAVSGQRSAVSGQRSAVSGQRSAVSGQRSAVSGQRSAVSGQRSQANTSGTLHLTTGLYQPVKNPRLRDRGRSKDARSEAGCEQFACLVS